MTLTTDQLDAAARVIDALPIYGWVPCASAAQTEANPRRWGWGLNPTADLRLLLEPGRPVRQHLDFGVDGLLLWLPFGTPHTGYLQDFAAFTSLSSIQQATAIQSLMAVDEEAKRCGCHRRTIVYFGAIRGESFRVRMSPDNDGTRVMGDDEAWDHVVRCVAPAMAIDCDIALDNTSESQQNPIAERMIVRLREWLRERGRTLYCEPGVHKNNTALHGMPGIETEQLFTGARSAWANGCEDVLRLVVTKSIRRWSKATGAKTYQINAAMVLADSARRTLRERREISVVAATDLMGGAKNSDELRANAKGMLSVLPDPGYWLGEVV